MQIRCCSDLKLKELGRYQNIPRSVSSVQKLAGGSNSGNVALVQTRLHAKLQDPNRYPVTKQSPLRSPHVVVPTWAEAIAPHP
jgi:hypothetical protein